MKAFKAIVEIVVIADSDGEASDAISEMIRPCERRLHSQMSIYDWRYLDQRPVEPIPGMTAWTELDVSPMKDFEEGAIFVNIPDATHIDPVIEVKNGCVQNVYGIGDAGYDLVDWDVAENGQKISISEEGLAVIPQELRDEIKQHNESCGGET